MVADRWLEGGEGGSGPYEPIVGSRLNTHYREDNLATRSPEGDVVLIYSYGRKENNKLL